MPDPITWGQLAKAVGDNTLIDSEIAALILAHNLDPSAHGQSNEAVYLHRIAAELDHIDQSITNAKIKALARAYTAIVDIAGNGDYTDLQLAINYVHSIGGGSVFVRPGTYLMDYDLTLYSNITIVGAGRELSILDFENKEHMVMMVGTSGTHMQNVVFESMTFQNLGRGDWFAFDMEYCDDCKFMDVKFYKITSSEVNDVITLYMENSQRCIAENCYFDTCDQAIYVNGGSFHKFEFNYFTKIPFLLLNVGRTPSVIFRHNVAYDIGTEGNDTIIYFGSGGDNLVIDSNLFELCRTQCIWSEVGSRISITNNVFTKTGTTYECIFLSDCTRSILANNRIVGFTNSGIYFSGGCDYCTIVGNVITGCGLYGVNIDHSSNHKNTVVGNALVGNSSGAVHDIGTSDVVASNSS